MVRNEVDFLDENDKIVNVPKKKKRFFRKLFIYLLIIFVILLVSCGVGIISSGESLSQTLGNLGLFGQIKHLMGSDDKQLAGENEDRINTLLLGMGGIENGVAHDGPFLTDTIMIASYKPSSKEVAMISIPRDLVAPIPGRGWKKINHANAYGEVKDPGNGGELATQVVSDLFEIPIHYYVRVDFAGFKQIVDDLGGIDVNVENILSDKKYPIPGKETATTSERYEHLYIEKGHTHMDGELALKYARSRQAAGIEGSDFARSKRQQNVLIAVKEKGLRFSTLVNPYKISKIIDTLSQHLATNVKVWEIIKFFNFSEDIEEKKIIRQVFNDDPGGLLEPSITESGEFVLRPIDNDFTEIKMIIQNIFDMEKLEEEKQKQEEIIEQARPKNIEIQNGTKINGLASRTMEYLESLDYIIVDIGNAPTQDYNKTVIYNLNKNPKDKTTTALAKLLDCKVADSVPSWTAGTEVNSQTDILIILGQDQRE